jgi:hypothetical protein
MKLGILVCAVLLMSGCSETERARAFSLNKYGKFTVKHFSGGVCVGTWHTNARPASEASSDGFTFVNNGKLMLVSGDVQISED